MKLRYRIARGIVVFLVVALSSLALVLSHTSACETAPALAGQTAPSRRAARGADSRRPGGARPRGVQVGRRLPGRDRNEHGRDVGRPALSPGAACRGKRDRARGREPGVDCDTHRRDQDRRAGLERPVRAAAEQARAARDTGGAALLGVANPDPRSDAASSSLGRGRSARGGRSAGASPGATAGAPLLDGSLLVRCGASERDLHGPRAHS